MQLFLVTTPWKAYLIVRNSLNDAVQEAHKREGRLINMKVQRIEETDGYKINLTPARTFDKCWVFTGDKVIKGGSGFIR